MNPCVTRRVLLASLLASVFGVFGASGAVHAQSYPTAKPITLLVGYPAGGSVDLVARLVAPELSKRLGQTVVVENITGAGGTVAAGRTVQAAPDGYTLLLGSGSEVAINKLTNTRLPYDGTTDLAAIGLIGTQPMVLVASSKTPVSNAEEFIKSVRANPGKFSYASSGVGTPLHLAGEMIKESAKVFMVHIPYRGAPQMQADLLGGQIEFGVFVLSSALPHIKSGKVKPIGVTETKRSPAAPDIPPLSDHPALKSVDMGVWFGLFAPAKTPADVQERLRKELSDALNSAELRKKLSENGVAIPTAPVDMRRFLQSEVQKYKRIVDFAKITNE